VVEEYTAPSPAIDSEIDEIAREWLATRKCPPMGFLLRSRPFAKRDRKRTFIASYDGRVVAAMTCSPAPARNMLYVEEQLRRPDAPYGTTELLVEEARMAAKADGLALLSLGTSPMQGAQSQPYGDFRAVKLLVRALFSRANVFYNFASLNHYKKKFAPTFWEDSFFIYRGSMVAAMLALGAAFAPDGLRSMVLPKRLRWLRFVPAAALWTAACAGVFVTGFAAWEFPVLTLPVRQALEGLELAGLPAGSMVGLTRGAVAAHRLITAVVLLGAGAAVWQRRARA
jgi:hypothetical protein